MHTWWGFIVGPPIIELGEQQGSKSCWEIALGTCLCIMQLEMNVNPNPTKSWQECEIPETTGSYSRIHHRIFGADMNKNFLLWTYQLVRWLEGQRLELRLVSLMVVGLVL